MSEAPGTAASPRSIVNGGGDPASADPEEAMPTDSLVDPHAIVAADAGGKPVDHWWGLVVSWGVFAVQFFLYGTMNSYPVFASSMSDDASLGNPSATEVSLGNSIMNGLAPIVGLFAGALCDRVGPRLVLGTGALLCAVGSFASSFVTGSVALMVVVYSLPVCMASGALGTPGSAAVSNWLERRVSTGMGIAYAGNGAGSSVIVVVAGQLVGLGWRRAFRWMALFPLVGGFLAAMVTSFRVPPTPRPALSPAERRFLAGLLCSSTFWVLWLSGALFSFTFFAALYIIVPYGASMGAPGTPYEDAAVISVGKATTLFTFFGVTKFIGSNVLGLVATRTEARLVYAMSAGVTAVTCAMWVFARTFAEHAVCCSVLGFGFSGMFATQPALAAACYAGPYAGLGIGLVLASFAVGGFLGPPIVTSIQALQGGGYNGSLALMAVVSVLSGAVVIVGGAGGRFRHQSFALGTPADAPPPAFAKDSDPPTPASRLLDGAGHPTRVDSAAEGAETVGINKSGSSREPSAA